MQKVHSFITHFALFHRERFAGVNNVLEQQLVWTLADLLTAVRTCAALL
jgi:hypothetical protein